jgi:hypothetical protein
MHCECVYDKRLKELFFKRNLSSIWKKQPINYRALEKDKIEEL